MDMTRRGFVSATMATTVAFRLSAALNKEIKPILGKIGGTLPPGRYDAHVHAKPGAPDPDLLKRSFAAAGLTGGCIFSERPNRWEDNAPEPAAPEKAMDNVIAWASGSPTIYPFYWIDPVRPDACDLVDMAVEKGICGFKVIQRKTMPCDPVAIPVYRKIAAAGKPLTFHSGILWDGQDSSTAFRPANWEGLLAVPGLRFALAHISWPWCDECIAVYGKLLNAISKHGLNVPEMFIDTTPGTPKIYRKDALTKIHTVGYDIFDHVMFGTDCRTTEYNVAWTKDWLETDDAIYDGLGLDERMRDSIYRGALQRFLFGGNNSDRKIPTPDGQKNK